MTPYDPSNDLLEGSYGAIVGLSEADLEALGIEMAGIWAKATKQASQEMTDKTLYGFAVRDQDGKRVDPKSMLKGRHRQLADFYDRR